MKMEGHLFKIYEVQRKQGFEREICNKVHIRMENYLKSITQAPTYGKWRKRSKSKLKRAEESNNKDVSLSY